MSAVTSSDLDVENPRLQNDPPQKRGCCRINRVCASMVPLETVTGVSGVSCALFGAFNTNSYASNGAYVAAAVLFSATLLEIFIHVCWGRDRVVADLAKTVEKGNQLAEQIEDTAEKVDEVAEKIKNENLKLKEQNKALTKTQKEFEKAQKTLNGEVDKLAQVNQALKGELKDFKAENKTLKLQIEQLQGVIKAIQEQLVQFNSHNNLLKKNVGELGEAIEDFDQKDDDLKSVFGEVDKALDLDIGELSKQVSLVKSQSQEIFTLLSKQIRDLKETIASLSASQQKVDKDEDDIRDRTLELKELELKLNQVNQELSARKDAFTEINRALEKSKEVLNQEIQQLDAAGSRLSVDRSHMQAVILNLGQMAERMEQLGAQISRDVASLNTLDSEAKRQQAEIDSL